MYYAVITSYEITKQPIRLLIPACMTTFQKTSTKITWKISCVRPLCMKNLIHVYGEREREGMHVNRKEPQFRSSNKTRDMESYFLDSRREYYICTVKTLRFWAWLCIKQIMLLFKTKRHVFLVYWVDILVPFTAWIYFPPFGACFLR